MANPQAEGRRFNRTKLADLPGSLKPWGSIARVRMIDVSPNGCCIEALGIAWQPFQRLLLRGNSRIGAPGTVRWATEQQAGIQFDRLLPRITIDFMLRDNRHGLQIILPAHPAPGSK